ncbi:UTP--glucose-1-phosphate uridylyltransferase GalU [Paenibacillus pini]|uniref:UTP--glucose-1-phosphate uridylyltransferase n=1 Tax=Paenibacillus pini JCM 16418 TaxID=1236976 RepID=W7YGI7_9BACL|nr:UTP--glucose-1-phosphate uridylyltransferase GalU [Paenibacillus pini]GAF06673.1 UTP-glucose-1-phosphate uridylyltransferase [Paenibacillus pini JCM 16418]
MKIRKAVIPAAGLGTRFLPATKAQPKEMLPIVDKPAIQYIVEEAVEAGIESIIIVTGRNKQSIENHFDRSVELEQALENKAKWDLLEEVKGISDMVNIHYIRQKEPLGLGHAILCAQQFIDDEPFAVLLGDDIMMSDTPALKQMMHVYERYKKQMIGVQPVPKQETSKYGIISYDKYGDRIYRVTDLVEKPAPEVAPTNIAVMGRYILNPSIFPELERLEKGAGDEYQLTDALRQLCGKEGILALALEGKRFDIGDKMGYMYAILEMAIQREELRRPLINHMQQLIQQETARS